MEKKKNNIKVLDEISKGCSMGIDALDDILNKVEDNKFRELLEKHKLNSDYLIINEKGKKITTRGIELLLNKNLLQIFKLLDFRPAVLKLVNTRFENSKVFDEHVPFHHSFYFTCGFFALFYYVFNKTSYSNTCCIFYAFRIGFF